MATYTYGANWIMGDAQAGMQFEATIRGERGDVVPFGADGRAYIVTERSAANKATVRMVPTPAVVELPSAAVLVAGDEVKGTIAGDVVTYADTGTYSVGVVVELVGREPQAGHYFVYIG